MRITIAAAAVLLATAAPAVAQAPASPVPAAMEALAHGKTTTERMEAAKALGASRDPAAMEPLVAALKDASRDVRWAAVEALGDLGDRRAVPALLEYVKKLEAYRWGKRLVADALGAIGDPRALDTLIALLDDEDPFVRRLAALAVLRLDDANDARASGRVAKLIATEDDTLGSVRREYARAAEQRKERVARIQPRTPPAAGAATPNLRPREWAGFKVGLTSLADARQKMGMPLQETKDFLLYGGQRITGAIATESVVINADAKGVVESVFVFPAWGTLDRDLHALLGAGKVMPYAEFLKMSGRTAVGAGTRAGGKLHYVPPDVMTESYAEMGMLVVYDSTDATARDRLVKLLIVY